MNEFKQIAIVGSGPGHPDFLTKRAMDYINQADILLYDCLVDPLILTAVPAHIKQERVEKKYKIGNGIDIFDQDILSRMMECADAGLQVVRIKPGDSMNFNSGGMENNYLTRKGYQVEMVAGVSAHVAASNLHGLNLTEIGQSNASATCIIDDIREQEKQLADLAHLMKYSSMPVCFYPMNVAAVKGLVATMQNNEICNKMPVAICCDVSLTSSKLIETKLGDCADLLDILANDDQLPDHFIIIMGKHIFNNYVDFKTTTKENTHALL
ncbi:uroporphyrinogen-III C-methyltransferase [Saccharicrinis aurantiacus]|uniref:uroporphyrinogen-III C-methyltransferase n=1 Tax=Saccharicrinis aurantiacus TaxID=1849719 RepID=UPI0024921BAF|nr:SAM-dependent methyltransferase [Saccharicrinis aurantiacus]